MSREFAEPGALAGVVRAAYGPGRRLARLARLRHGSKKGVYRLGFDDGGTAMLYVWSPVENYWPDGHDAAEPFAGSSGLGLFEASHARLSSLGVPVPRVHLLDGSKELYPADLALVEDVPGGTLEDLLDRDPRRAEQAMTALNAALRALHGQRGEGIGKLGGPRVERPGSGKACADILLERAVAHLDDAAAQIGRVAAARSDLAEVVHTLAAQVPARTEHRLIHGELGPDHVLIRADGQPVVIDIEGVMFFDVEWEHVFLALRFGDSYRWLKADGLDETRLRFYALAMHLSLIAGPLRLLAGDYPDREPFLRIIEYNTARALSFLPDSRQP
jgi:Phosphotransferase enzyme family